MFQLESLDAPTAAIDELPRGLWLPALIHHCGGVAERIDTLIAWRSALLNGTSPAPDRSPWALDFVAAIQQLNLARYTQDNESVADQVVRSVWWHVEQALSYADRNREPLDDAYPRAAEAFTDDWTQNAEDLESLLYVFDSLGNAVRFARWDAIRGMLSSGPWQQLLAIRRTLEDLQPLRELIASLGRVEPDDTTDDMVPVLRAIAQTENQWVPQTTSVELPGAPIDLKGIQRSADLARLAAGDAGLLTRPRFKRLFYARFAERALTTYDYEDIWRERVPQPHPQPVTRESLMMERRLTMGPLIVCVDTSGSMQGGPEAVAKAVVLEALRVAHKQGRACYVYAFGAAGEVTERELRLDDAGIETLLDFVGQSFHGGTDVAEPITRAINKLSEEAWKRADLLIASDGEFGVTPATLAALDDAKQTLKLRVQGILIGDRETMGLLDVCDDIYWLAHWRDFEAGHEKGFTPVHSKSLTALYFPNALRKPLP